MCESMLWTMNRWAAKLPSADIQLDEFCVCASNEAQYLSPRLENAMWKLVNDCDDVGGGSGRDNGRADNVDSRHLWRVRAITCAHV